MKTKLHLLIGFLLFAQAPVYPQCSGCSSTISSSTSEVIVNSGQTACITSTGVVLGGVIVEPGGILCNEGKIYGGAVVLAGGVINNYGDTIIGGITIWGNFNNYNSLIVEGGINVWDSLNNYGLLTIMPGGGLTVDSGGYFKNAAGGKIVIGSGFTLGDAAGNTGKADNFGCIHVTDGGFVIYNVNSSFYSESMVVVDNGGFVNHGTVSGPSVSCSGIKVNSGGSVNTGTYGVTGNMDICDVANPSTGFGYNGGTLGSNTTFCVCQNFCNIVGIPSDVSDPSWVRFFPNPTDRAAILSFTGDPGLYQMEIYNLLGERIYAQTIYKTITGSMEIEISTNQISKGLYALNIIGKNSVLRTSFVKE